MKIVLVGPERRGLAMGFNEAAGYGAVAAAALATGFIAAYAGLRPQPFFLGVACAGLSLGLSTLFVRETAAYARQEAADHTPTGADLHHRLATRDVFWLTSIREPAFSVASQAGLVNNLNDGVACGICPIVSALLTDPWVNHGCVTRARNLWPGARRVERVFVLYPKRPTGGGGQLTLFLLQVTGRAC